MSPLITFFDLSEQREKRVSHMFITTFKNDHRIDCNNKKKSSMYNKIKTFEKKYH